jgi:hypothetical protein
MRRLTVFVLAAQRSSYWYADLLGLSFEVYDDGRGYVLAEDYDLGRNAPWRHIVYDDAAEIAL